MLACVCFAKALDRSISLALHNQIKQILVELKTLGSSPILEEVPKFVDKAQLAQHIKGKDRQLPKFHTLQKGLAPSLLLDVSFQGGT